MRKLLLIAVVLLGMAAPAVRADDFTWWHTTLTQPQRTQRILDRARQDVGRYVGLNCKEWARAVVLQASSGVMNIPPTLPDENGWYWAYEAYVVELCILAENVQPGAILQMKLRSNGAAHTAIVEAVTPSGMYFLESNWAPPYQKIVNRRFVTYPTFYQQVQDFTVHYIY